VLEVGIAVLAIIAGTIGYFGRRFIERHGTSERLDRAAKVLDLHKRMQRHNLSPADLDEIEDRLLAKNQRIRIIEDQALLERAEDTKAIVTQAEMNQQAMDAFGAADEKLNHLFARVNEALPNDLNSTFAKSQSAWTRYRDAQADLLAMQFEGGSMQPLVRASELERLTIARIAEIKDFIDEHEKMFG